MIFTPKFPLVLGAGDMLFSNAEIKDIVLFHLKNVILTSPGEKITDPDYGVGIKRYLFEQMTTGTLNLISKRISSAISRYLSYLDLVSVNVLTGEREDALYVSIKYRLPGIGELMESNIEFTPNSSSY